MVNNKNETTIHKRSANDDDGDGDDLEYFDVFTNELDDDINELRGVSMLSVKKFKIEEFGNEISGRKIEDFLHPFQ